MSGAELLLLCVFVGYMQTNLNPKYTMWANNNLKMKKHKYVRGDTSF